MYVLVIWLNEDTTVPSVVGPYEDDKVFEWGNMLREVCYKVLVCNLTKPDNARMLFSVEERARGN